MGYNLGFKGLIKNDNTGNLSLNVTLKRVRVRIVAVEKSKYITCSEFVSEALVIQHANVIRYIIS